MQELNSGGRTGEVVAASGNFLTRVVRYGVLITQLGFAAARLRGLSEQIRATYAYVEGCAAGVDQTADQMSGLTVDVDTVGEFHQAATIMRGALDDADAMASGTEDLAALFEEAREAHQADYGAVVEAVHAMPVPMADASFYSNR
jgi:methyl-accepting chemotaxis protein